MEIKQKFFIVTKGSMYLKDSRTSSVFRMGVSGKPKLYTKKAEAAKVSERILGSSIKRVMLTVEG